ncbi:MAG: nitrous oxide-stimulated promoter family protein [Denitrovibrio sp.]|nr:MAG: nitrous oxide-stimulated promoter family protein [Denitrovibrio sp.]
MKKEKRINKDAKILNAFINIYCRENHGTAGEICQPCAELLNYALKRNDKCPLDPKPLCKKCPVHCYKPEMRAEIRKVMRFSGIYAIKHGRLDLIFHYFF